MKMNLEGRNCLVEFENKNDVTENVLPARKLRQRGKAKEQSPFLSVQDLLMVAFQSCDPMLQQLMTEKLFMAKIAIPFLLPSPTKTHTQILTSWAFRSTLLEWRGREESAACFRAKTVSFLRIGRPAESKSSLLNEIIADNKQHSFFNRDCPQGGQPYNRILTDGSVELAWFLPETEEKDQIAENATRILNLRGDAIDFTEQVEQTVI